MPLQRFTLLAALSLTLAACEAPATAVLRTPMPVSRPPVVTADPGLQAGAAAQNFLAVVQDMEPRIEAECRARTRGPRSCDYRVLVDDTPAPQPNAFQTIDRGGRPVVAFNRALIAEARNADELAFVMGHEAAHYILGHLEQKTSDATTGALIFGVLAAASGADPAAVSQARDIGAEMGARAYSKEYELEADRLGAVIAWNAGYDPVRGALFFTRIPDPGHSFLGTHPANGARIEAVRQVVAALHAGKV